MFRYPAKVQFFFQKLKSGYVYPKLSRDIYRTAALIRTDAKRSMRMRAGPGKPGHPPHAHTRAGLRQIRFVVDRSRLAAIVGPLKFPGSRFFDAPVPHMHEFGGTYFHRLVPYTYPERSYMYHSVKKLQRKGLILKQFKISPGRIV